MKTLLTTTALVLATALPVSAEDNSVGTSHPFVDSEASVATDLRASDLIGMRIYTSEVDVDVFSAPEVETEWDDIGEVNDIILARDGSAQSVLLDIGGFLGIGEKTVAVDMNQLKMVADSDDPGDYFIVFTADRDALESAPEFGVEHIGTWTTVETNDVEVAHGTSMKAPMIDRDGFEDYHKADLTAERLTGAPVYDTKDEWIGEVSEILLTDNGKVKGAVLDVGGFLGIGEKRVETDLSSLTIKREVNGGDVRVYVDTTKDALESMPDYSDS
jgi:sporulation protein YlmC with PRC-barrel domain